MTTTETAGVTLRAALEKLADRWGTLDDPVFTSAGVILKNTLDARPDNTTQEWGLESFDGNDVMLTRNKERACELLMSDEYLVSRRVTAWQREA